MIKELKWDTNLFKKKIAKIEIKKKNDEHFIEQLSSEYDLIYIFSSYQIKSSHRL
jgi:hypothetical protein